MTLNLMLRIIGEQYENFTSNKQTIEGSSLSFNQRFLFSMEVKSENTQNKHPFKS